MKKIKKCFLFGSNSIEKLYILPEKDDFIIAVDGGFDNCLKFNIKPDYVVGDFDSINYINYLKVKKNCYNFIKLNKKKDKTDMLVAIELGLKEKCDIFLIYGGSGGRISHTFANIQCIAWLSENKKDAYIFDDDHIITLVTNGCISFPEKYKGLISVFSYSKNSYNVTIKGLKYEIENMTLNSKFPIGVSNEFIGKKSSVLVDNGSLLIILELKSLFILY